MSQGVKSGHLVVARGQRKANFITTRVKIHHSDNDDPKCSSDPAHCTAITNEHPALSKAFFSALSIFWKIVKDSELHPLYGVCNTI